MSIQCCEDLKSSVWTENIKADRLRYCQVCNLNEGNWRSITPNTKVHHLIHLWVSSTYFHSDNLSPWDLSSCHPPYTFSICKVDVFQDVNFTEFCIHSVSVISIMNFDRHNNECQVIMLFLNPFSARGLIYRPPLCLRIMREADVSAHFFQALQ